MHSSTNAATASFPSLSSSPAGLTDTDLLTATRRLVGRSNQLLAALLAHLGEVEARGIHRTRACSSLYMYCIYELRFSEDEAFRRTAAARLVRRFPALLDVVATGELHLTGLLMLGPHLTDSNLVEVLARARHRTKKEIARLVRQLDPLPDVPPRIEPLGPAPARLVTEAPTWSTFVQSMCPVRELPPGDRPRDWANPTENETEGANDADVHEGSSERALPTASEASLESAEPSEQPVPAPAPARVEPQRYKVQFTASDEYVKLVEEAQALLSRSAPRATLDELHLRAMRAFVNELKRQKYAVTARPRNRKGGGPPEGDALERARESESEAARESESEHPRQRGRYVPAAVRRAVFERDDGRCTYADASGRRCCETHSLELHHVEAFAQGGANSEENLTLRCGAHNALAAEEDFGRDFMELKRDSRAHEPWVSRGGR